MKKLKEVIIEVLKKDNRLWHDESNEFNQSLLFDLIENYDERLMNFLLENKRTKEAFFIHKENIFIFKVNDFKFFMEENKIYNSFTKFSNKIGLYNNNTSVLSQDIVVLNYPFKDCLLAGGQATEEGMDLYYEFDNTITKTEEKKGYLPNSFNQKSAKRNEIFFNEILAQDEIDRLLDEKALINWKRYTKEGQEKVDRIKRNQTGLIKENLIIRGNNLLALHTLKSNFAGKVKLIYIDPPYNTGNDEFKYNDRFNHSTWLTFMKNRLEVAKELLSDDGVILVQCDHHELGYLNVLMDEIFNTKNKVQVISCKTSAPAGFKTVNPGPIDVTEYILYYSKDKTKVNFKRAYTAVDYDSNYNRYIENFEDNPENWKIVSIIDKFYEEAGIKGNSEAKKIWGKHWKIIRDYSIGDFALENSNRIVSERDPHNPTKTIKELMKKSRKTNTVIEHKRENDSIYLYNGSSLAFYSNKVKQVDGQLSPTELLTDFWSDISWAGIANEGGVKLKNGKKPEKLLHRIIEMTTEEGDIVLDYHLGSGTTAAVAHKMNRQYIGIEQLDYKENDPTIRLNNVINGDSSGISKMINWTNGGSFIYFELAEWNEKAKQAILECNNFEELSSLFKIIYEKYFLNYNVKIKDFKEEIINQSEFNKLSLMEQKKMFISMLDLNQLYIQRSEMNDKQYGLKESDKIATELFYEGE